MNNLIKRFLYDLNAIGSYILAKRFLSDHESKKTQSNNQAINQLIFQSKYDEYDKSKDDDDD